MLIAILKYKGKKLYIDLKSLEKKLEGQIVAYWKENGKRRTIVGHLEYTLRIAEKSKTGVPYEIYIDNIDVNDPFKKKGYGKIVVGFLQAIAQASNLKITLYSLGDVVGFYRKCGFHPAIPYSQDMVWFPKKRKKRNANLRQIKKI